MFTISKEFSFCASHTLMGLAEEHSCSRLHGHNYIIIVEFQSSTLDEVGLILDPQEMDPIKVYIDRMLDHKHLNDVFTKINPTAELLAEYLFHVFQSIFEVPHRSQLSAVTVKETPATAARYEPK